MVPEVIMGTLLLCATVLAVDGDTIKCNGISMRDMGDGTPNKSGYDTPETHNAKCQEELELGRAATAARVYVTLDRSWGQRK